MNLIDPREKRYFGFVLAISILAWCVCSATIFLMFYAVVIGLFIWMANGLLVAQLKSNAVKVDAEQMPQLASVFARLCGKLEVSEVPELYILQSEGFLNALGKSRDATEWIGWRRSDGLTANVAMPNHFPPPCGTYRR